MQVGENQLEQRNWICQETVESYCRLCGKDKRGILTTENGLGIVKCQECGLIYVNPRPSENELQNFYRQYLRSAVSGRWQRATSKLFLRDAQRIEHYYKRGRLFDIGCGFGFFLQVMKERGWQVHGCDYSAVAVDYAQNQLDLPDVGYTSFQHCDCQEGYFDVITAWYVLHHVSEPDKVLSKAAKALKPGGIIAIRVPSIDLFKLLWTVKKMDCKPVRFLLNHVRKETGNPLAPYNVLDPPLQLYGYNPQVLCRFLEVYGLKALAVYNDGMVERGNLFNRTIDRGVTALADLVKRLTRGQLDLSISFSIYARKM